jgi:hypothetical protein
MNKFHKYSKPLLFSVLSLLLYYFIENSSKINAMLLMLQESSSPKGLSYFIFINIGKWFLGAFGFIGLFFWVFKMFIKKDEKDLSGF